MKNYKGLKIKVVDSVYKELNGKEATVIGQDLNEQNEIIICLNIPHPEDKKADLWVNVSEIKEVKTITRFAVIPDERRLLLGIDKANLFEAGYVYEAFEVMDEIVIRKVGKYALPETGSHPNEYSDAGAQICSGLHLVTKKEIENLRNSEE